MSWVVLDLRKRSMGILNASSKKPSYNLISHATLSNYLLTIGLNVLTNYCTSLSIVLFYKLLDSPTLHAILSSPRASK